MVNHTALNKNTTNSTVSFEVDSCKSKNTSSHKNPDGPFVWTKANQGIILSSYFGGYFISQIPGNIS